MAASYDLLKAFVRTASASNFREAAALERVSVSAISQKIRTLEAQMGTPLFERVGRRVRLLPAGTILRDALQTGFSQIDDAIELLHGDFTHVKGSVAIGSPRAFGRHWLRPRMADLLSNHPDLRLHVEFDVPSVLETSLVERRLDFVLLARATDSPEIAVEKIATESFVAVASPSFVKRVGTPRELHAFQTLRWAIFDSDRAMHDVWWRAAFGRKAPSATNIACEVASLDELLALAEAGIAAVVLPDYFVKDALAERRVRELVPDRFVAKAAAENALYLAWRKSAARSARFEAVYGSLRADSGKTT